MLTDVGASAPLQPLPNPYNVPVALMASADVAVDSRAIAQAMRLAALRPVLRALGGELERVLLTPDLHRGPELAVGVVFDTAGALIPGAIGNDIGCGMHLAVLSVVADALSEEALVRVGARLRAIFFEGARNLPLRSQDRLAVFEYGLPGLLEASHVRAGAGLWRHLDDWQAHTPALRGSGVDARMRAWAQTSGERDAQLGSLAGGNHFCELQRVAEIRDGPTAWRWGLRPGSLCVMTHSGSLGFGHLAAAGGRAAAHATRPARWDLPAALLPLSGAGAERYLRAMTNAANFAAANRLALTLMAVDALRDELGEVAWSSVGDLAHNLICSENARFRHRKGACPAEDKGPFAYTGQPVFIPGSMGDDSWVLAGLGNETVMSSTAHGAGRLLSRSQARKHDDERLARLQVVTRVSPTMLARAGRRDLIAEQTRRLREEAPRAYKPVVAVVDSVVAAAAARRVCRMEPLLTVKG